MLPDSGSLLRQEFKIEEQPSKTYRIRDDTIQGREDGLEAVKQTVYCILNTERYESILYSWNYGVELKDLFGKPMGYVKSELKRRITEALTQDDRIRSVGAFSFSVSGRNLSVTFTVYTTLGDFEAGKEVRV